MALTKKRIEDTLGTLIVKKNDLYYIHESDVDIAIQRITGSFHGCYAMVKTVGIVGKKLLIGNAVSRVGKPIVEIIIRDNA